jgi:hypothetical protein
VVESRLSAICSAMLLTVTALLDACRASGAVRDDIDSEDLVTSSVGIFTVAGATQRAQAGRLLDLLMDGLQASRSIGSL